MRTSTMLMTTALWALLQTPVWAASTIRHDGSLGPASTVAADRDNIYTILQSRGITRGNNLFHSFSRFDLGQGDAAWFASQNIRNIISRITDSRASTINGALGAEANLYLINPHGLVFGPEATTMDVTGAFYATTADYLSFGAGHRFYADTSHGSHLMSVNPTAFGFLGQPAAIAIQGSILGSFQGQDIGLIGGNITQENGHLVTFSNSATQSGSLYLAALGGPGEVTLTAMGPEVSAGTPLGDITITRTTPRSSINLGTRAVYLGDVEASGGFSTGGENFVSWGGASGNIYMVGRNLSLAGRNVAANDHDQVWVMADQFSQQDDGLTGSIHIHMAGQIRLNAAGITTDVLDRGSGPPIMIQAARVSLDNDSAVASRTFGAGSGGSIEMYADRGVRIAHGSRVTSDSILDETNAGTAGTIGITSPSELVLDGGFITAAAAQGGGGSITVQVGHLIQLENARITTSVHGGDENAGNIFLDPDLFIMRNSEIRANADRGAGGRIVRVANAMIEDTASVVDASSRLGVDGTVETRAPDMDITDNLGALPTSFFDASGLLKEACGAAARRGAVSSFVLSGRGGMPKLPEDVRPSAPMMLHTIGGMTLVPNQTRMQLAALPGVSLECLML